MNERQYSQGDQRSRDIIFTQERRAVLVQIRADQTIPGMNLPKKGHNEEAVNEKRVTEAKNRGLDPMGYMRGKPDTGTQVLNCTSGVRASNLLDQLQEKGLHYVYGWYYVAENDKVVYCLQFSVDGEKAPLPEMIKEILRRRYGTCNIWANPRTDQETGRRLRTDSINLGNPFAVQDAPARELTLEGNTYRLV